MERETELDAALIDAFDVETAPPQSLRFEDSSVRRKIPIASDSRGLYNTDTPVTPVTPIASFPKVGAGGRYYPSLDALPAPAPSANQQPFPATIRRSSYPRFESVSVPAHPIHKESVVHIPSGSENLHPPQASNPQTSKAPPTIQDRTAHEGQAAQCTPSPPKAQAHIPTPPTLSPYGSMAPHELTSIQEPVVNVPYDSLRRPTNLREPRYNDPTYNSTPAMSKAHVYNDGGSPPPSDVSPIPTDEEIEHQRRQLECQVHRFAQQADYMALALTGDTPHQIEMRRHREKERKERDERRVAAVEARVEHMVERELQREARLEERRQRHISSMHRASLNPSPERSPSDHSDNEREDPEGKNMEITE